MILNDPKKFWEMVETLGYIAFFNLLLCFVGSIVIYGFHIAHILILGGLVFSASLIYFINNIETWMRIVKK